MVTITFLLKVVRQKYPMAKYLSEKCVWRQKNHGAKTSSDKLSWLLSVMAPKRHCAKMTWHQNDMAPKCRRQNVVDSSDKEKVMMGRGDPGPVGRHKGMLRYLIFTQLRCMNHMLCKHLSFFFLKFQSPSY